MVALLLVSVLFCSAPAAAVADTAETALTAPDMLQITSVKLAKASKDLVVRMVFTNAGETGITECGVALAFYDQSGARLYAYPATLEGYMSEACNWYYTPQDVIKAGETYQTEDSFTDYVNAVKLEVAIRYFRKESGDYVNLPVCKMVWFF